MKNPDDFELLLFSTDPQFIRMATTGGVAGVVVDWERNGKSARQRYADTQISHDTPEDLRRVRAATRARVLCRVNSLHEGTAQEVEEAVAAGADEILLPMVRAVRDVEEVLSHVGGRCRVGILVETVEATREAAMLAGLPLSRVYVGLNDLAIERGHENIFTAVVDGTVERLRASFDAPFGFGGLTLPERGHPVPCRLLIGEMARLDCHFSFLRRSFHRDVAGHDAAREIARIHESVARARGRNSEEVARDRSELACAVEGWRGTA